MGCVYIIKGGDCYKIGITSAGIASRLRALQTSSPFPLIFVHQIATDNPRALESALHARFADQRRHGEWFALSNKDIRWLMRYSDKPSPESKGTWLGVGRQYRDEYGG